MFGFHRSKEILAIRRCASIALPSISTPGLAITTSSNFSVNPDNASVISLEFDFAETEAFTLSKLYTPGATANANCDITTQNKFAGSESGSAYITEPSLNTLLFRLPDSYIAANVSNTIYQFKRKFTGVEFSAGVNPAAIVANTNEQFIGDDSTSNTAQIGRAHV